MTLHLIKLCVGVASVEELEAWRRAQQQFGGFDQRDFAHRTRMFPKRSDEIVGSGSLYWVMSGAIQCRQSIIALERGKDETSRGYCDIVMDPEIVRTRVQPKRPFQGWRYLASSDAPADLFDAEVEAEGDTSLAAELSELGLP